MKLQTIVITLAMSFVGAALQAQVVIDPLDGTSGISYTTYLVNDTSHGAGNGVSFTQSSSGLQESFVGSTSTAEQALSLASASDFSTTFGVGDILSVDSSVAATTTGLDFGLAISANNPVAGSAPGYDARGAFDWLSISIRPSATAAVGTIRVTYSLNGSVQTGSFHTDPSLSAIDGLYIGWVTGTTFDFGYITTGNTLVQDGTLTFASGSTIGSNIGFYGDLRATGTSLGNFSNLGITSVPEPSTLALCGMGLVGLAGLVRRKSK